eukprot:491899-Prymnesium_polylepis.1
MSNDVALTFHSSDDDDYDAVLPTTVPVRAPTQPQGTASPATRPVERTTINLGETSSSDEDEPPPQPPPRR